MEATFKAQIKKVENKSFVSGDDGVRLILDKDGMDVETLNKINSIKSSDKNRSQEITVKLSDSD